MVPDRGDPLIIADRSLHLATAANFRDPGGYRTADGKWVRMGLGAMMARGGSQTGNAGQQYAAVHQTANSSQPAAGGGSRQEFEQRIYRDFVRLASARAAYRLLFERLADPKALPTVFHCTAGKDRIGSATAVFLTILGVPRQTIVQDQRLRRALQPAPQAVQMDRHRRIHTGQN
jgi:protein-tyrosine phosphatase